MMAGRMKECLERLRWSEDDLAEELGCSSSEVQTWFNGRKHPPLAVAAWLEALVKAHRSVPAPNLDPASSRKGHAPVRDAQIVLPQHPSGYSTSRDAQQRPRRPFAPSVISAPPIASRQPVLKGSSHASHPL
jgi:transcriptional regulator with XRE-family HTH domain